MAMNVASTVKKVSFSLKWGVIILLMIDISAAFVIPSLRLLENDQGLLDKIGYGTNKLTTILFYVKIIFFFIECSSINYSYDVEELYTHLKNNHGEKPELERVFTKRHSLKYRILKPAALFMFCLGGIVYSLVHPSILFFVIMPFCLFGFFVSHNQYKAIT